MKRSLRFNIDGDSFIVSEDSNILFQISRSDLTFDSKKFYLGIYSNNQSSNIVLTNDADPTIDRNASYVYKWLNEIITEIRQELNEDSLEDLELQVEDSVKKVIWLYDMAVCAGVGDILGSEDLSKEPFETNQMDADYALKISGHSMEPTYADGCIVLVKSTKIPIDGRVGIFNVDGKSMCKRYKETVERKSLHPDNPSPEYEPIIIKEGMVCEQQGIVIGSEITAK